MKKFISNRLFLIPSLIFIGLVIGVFVKFSSSSLTQNTLALAKRGELLQEVSVTGRVKAAQNVDLAFEKLGKINRVNVSVGSRVFTGQFLVGQNNANLQAQLAEAEANIRVQEAELEELRLGTRPEEISVAEAKVNDARKELTDKLEDSYTKSEDAVRNKVDQFFSNSRGADPKLNINTGNTSLESRVEQERFLLETVLTDWDNSLDSILPEKNLDPFIASADENLDRIKDFLADNALLVNSLTPGSGITQATIDAYKTDVSTARTNVNTAISNLSTAESDLLIKKSELNVKLSGTLEEQIKAAEAEVEKAEASADKIKAQINDTNIFSPIGGVVTRQDAKIGEIVSANTILVSIISDSKFEIEANVPEIDITKIKIGDPTSTTLDAYGRDVVFETKVVSIDPAETIIEGVATYKVVLQFVEDDNRVRPGMTANLDILTDSRQDVIFIPQRAVLTKNGEKIVRVLNETEEVIEVSVKTGMKGSNGSTEIVEGIEEGDKVIIFSSQ